MLTAICLMSSGRLVKSSSDPSLIVSADDQGTAGEGPTPCNAGAPDTFAANPAIQSPVQGGAINSQSTPTGIQPRYCILYRLKRTFIDDIILDKKKKHALSTLIYLSYNH